MKGSRKPLTPEQREAAAERQRVRRGGTSHVAAECMACASLRFTNASLIEALRFTNASLSEALRIIGAAQHRAPGDLGSLIGSSLLAEKKRPKGDVDTKIATSDRARNGHANGASKDEALRIKPRITNASSALHDGGTKSRRGRSQDPPAIARIFDPPEETET